jgi:glycosyltransferase involved in cell wall biosynthesis
MATYNGAQFLEEQIESILSQTLAPSLFIVYDDGSTDDTFFILQKYQEQEKLLCYQNESRLGLAANFKQGISRVPAGYYFALSDQDDIWHTKLNISPSLV